ncbi:hypothetical protein [Reyranella sp.]|uniref:hypothetical protein n=1 Tax=Reyranella sp. TaxID=1929291 RepID=UPI003C7B36C8
MNTLPGVWLDDLTRQEVASRLDGNAVVLVPVVLAGTPAPHLPLKTAALIARALGQALLQRLPVVLAPVIDADSFSRPEMLERVLGDRLDGLRALGARRIVVLEISPSPLGTPQVLADGLVVRAGDRLADDEYVTSCLMALDPRSVRMPLLPASSRSQAFAGERGMSAEVDEIATAVVSKWPDLI